MQFTISVLKSSAEYADKERLQLGLVLNLWVWPTGNQGVSMWANAKQCTSGYLSEGLREENVVIVKQNLNCSSWKKLTHSYIIKKYISPHVGM